MFWKYKIVFKKLWWLILIASNNKFWLVFSYVVRIIEKKQEKKEKNYILVEDNIKTYPFLLCMVAPAFESKHSVSWGSEFKATVDCLKSQATPCGPSVQWLQRAASLVVFCLYGLP